MSFFHTKTRQLYGDTIVTWPSVKGRVAEYARCGETTVIKGRRL